MKTWEQLNEQYVIDVSGPEFILLNKNEAKYLAEYLSDTYLSLVKGLAKIISENRKLLIDPSNDDNNKIMSYLIKNGISNDNLIIK